MKDDTILSSFEPGRTRRLTVACVQARAHERDAFSSRLPELLALIERAAQGAQLVVVPEGTVPAYVIGKLPVRSQQIDQARDAIAQIAARYHTTIVYGTARLERGETFNSAVVIGPDGAVLGYADKQFLWHFDRHWFARGERLEPITTPVGRLGVLVCADGRIPTIAATLVDRGAEILVMPTAWVTSGRDPAVLENVQADLMVPVRARENGVPFVAANKCGVEADSVLYCGKSLIADSRGMVISRASDREENVIVGEIELGEPNPTRAAHAPARVGSQRAPATHARIALTPADDPREIRWLAEQAAAADADVLIARGSLDAPSSIPVIDVTGKPDAAAGSGIDVEIVDAGIVHNPHGLVEARLSGAALFAYADTTGPATVDFARTRALELRVFVIVVTPERAFACDPDGAIVCGTVGEFRVAAFAYARTRTEQTLVAPGTDVLDGLRQAQARAACVR